MISVLVRSTICALALHSGSSFAQTCAAPGATITLPNFATLFNSTCTGADEFNSICQGSITALGTSSVYRLNNPNPLPSGVFIRVDPPDSYDVAIFLIGPDSCLQTTPCIGADDAAGPGGVETIAIDSNLAPGEYYLVIDSTAGTTGCLPSIVQIMSVPVTLQSFSID